MKINFKDEYKKDTLISYIVTKAFEKTTWEEQQKLIQNTPGGSFLDVVLTVNGIEVNLQSFMKRWQSCVEKEVDEAAREILRDRYCDLHSFLERIEEIIETELDNRKPFKVNDNGKECENKS